MVEVSLYGGLLAGLWTADLKIARDEVAQVRFFVVFVCMYVCSRQGYTRDVLGRWDRWYAKVRLDERREKIVKREAYENFVTQYNVSWGNAARE